MLFTNIITQQRTQKCNNLKFKLDSILTAIFTFLNCIQNVSIKYEHILQ